MSDLVTPDLEEAYDRELEEPIAVVANGKDLSEFSELRKVAWEARAERIRNRFDSVDQLDWNVALERDIDLFGRVLRDILKLEQAVPGRPGPRPSLDTNSAIRRMMQLLGHDFSIQRFPEALRILADDRSVRALAHKVQLDRNTVYRLLQGQIEPDGFHMRMCADAFSKHPSYFVEWRILYITAAITRRLEWSPEASIGVFRRLDHQRKMQAS